MVDLVITSLLFRDDINFPDQILNELLPVFWKIK